MLILWGLGGRRRRSPFRAPLAAHHHSTTAGSRGGELGSPTPPPNPAYNKTISSQIYKQKDAHAEWCSQVLQPNGATLRIRRHHISLLSYVKPPRGVLGGAEPPQTVGPRPVRSIISSESRLVHIVRNRNKEVQVEWFSDSLQLNGTQILVPRPRISLSRIIVIFRTTLGPAHIWKRVINTTLLHYFV